MWKLGIYALDSKDWQYLFLLGCRNGYLNVVNWLYKKSIKINYPINIHCDDDEVFSYSCTNGQLEVVKWLYELSVELHEPFDIYRENNYDFLYSCKYNHLNVAQWLFNLSVKLGKQYEINSNSVDYEIILKTCCEKIYIDMIEWLCTIQPEFYKKK